MMTRFSAFHTRRLLLAGIMAGAGLLGATLQATGVSAHSTVCRSDPLVFLSDGAYVELTADVYTIQPDINTVAYTVHVPAGVRLTHVQFTNGPLGRRETFQLVNDEPAGTYGSDVSVDAGPAGTSVTATMAAFRGGRRQQGSANGTVHQLLHVQLGAPGHPNKP